MTSESARTRAVRSFFTFPGDRPTSLGVCRGLSCELAGAAALHTRLSEADGCNTVYCLGLCDRSPALLLPNGTTVHGGHARAWPATGPQSPIVEVDVRHVSRRAVVTERLGAGSHATLADARRAGVYRALAGALQTSSANILDMVEASGQQGRGGAGFRTGRKWRACAEAQGPRRYVVANGDEGDPGSFIDRLLLEDDPHAVIEGMLICAHAVGASEGVVYIRAEYPQARERMTRAVVEARDAGLLGPSVMGSSFAFDLQVVGGHGSYVCGEETALLNAIEGRRGEVRVRPPYPAQVGLYGCPTVVNNIETLVNIPWIIREGVEAYRQLGTADSPGTKAFCLNHGFARPGIVEAEFGLILRELIEVHAGGGSGGEPLVAVALGGPMGSILAPEQWNLTLAYEALRPHHVQLGHGGLVAIPATADLRALLRNWVQFMADESCGRCVPCALGSQRALELIGRWCIGTEPDPVLTREIERLMNTVETASLCGFGQSIPAPLMTLMRLITRHAGGEAGGHG